LPGIYDNIHCNANARQNMARQPHGQVKITGTPARTVTPSMLRQVFGVEAEIVPDPRTGMPLCLPYDVVGVTD
jgi:iron complex transport system ATP-binding protein